MIWRSAISIWGNLTPPGPHPLTSMEVDAKLGILWWLSGSLWSNLAPHCHFLRSSLDQHVSSLKSNVHGAHESTFENSVKRGGGGKKRNQKSLFFFFLYHTLTYNLSQLLWKLLRSVPSPSCSCSALWDLCFACTPHDSNNKRTVEAKRDEQKSNLVLYIVRVNARRGPSHAARRWYKIATQKKKDKKKTNLKVTSILFCS